MKILKLKKTVAIVALPLYIAMSSFMLFAPSTAAAFSVPVPQFAAITCEKGDQDAACQTGGSSTAAGDSTQPNPNCEDTTQGGGSSTISESKLQKCLKTSAVVKDIQTIVDFLSGLVGIVVVGSIMWGGIMYISSGDNPGMVTQSKKRITNSLIALVVFLLIEAILQYLIPGGLFG